MRVRSYLPAVCLLLPALAAASTANFDSFNEGYFAQTIEDGGITFFDLDQRIPGQTTYNFVIEDASGTLSGSFFSPPNTLGFGGYSPGSGAAFTRCGEFKMKTGQVATTASMELFTFDFDSGNTVSLEAIRNGSVVQSQMMNVVTGSIHHYTLSVSGVQFDTLRIVGAGPANEGCFFGLFDNVQIGSSAVVVNPTSFAESPGIVLSGNLNSLFSSDDNKLVSRPGVVVSSSQAPVSIVVEGTAPGSMASVLQLVVESSANQANIGETVEVYNFVSGSYDAPLSSTTLTTSDVVKTLAIPNPNDHIGPGNLLRVRLRYKASGPVLSYPWQVRDDEVTWRLTQ